MSTPESPVPGGLVLFSSPAIGIATLLGGKPSDLYLHPSPALASVGGSLLKSLSSSQKVTVLVAGSRSNLSLQVVLDPSESLKK